jgi:hypothetical protein
MSVLGDFVNAATGTFSVTLGGGPSGTEVSHLTVGGDATLAGRLEVDFGPNSISPVAGDVFQILSAAGSLSGAFAIPPITPNLGPNLSMMASYENGTVLLRVVTGGGPPPVTRFGDFNDDGVVDARDYVLWRNGGPLLNDQTPGVQPADYQVWLANFGNAYPGSGAGFAANVPEPMSGTLAIAGLLALVAGRRARSCGTAVAAIMRFQ